jgi:DNA-3-methyladenine glycosylase
MNHNPTKLVGSRLELDFYRQPTEQLAQDLLGKLLVRRTADGQRLSGIVVEVEAYLSHDDPASHSSRGLGKKNASMFLPPATLYVYPIHTRHCLNVVSEPPGRGAAVLIRGIEPWEGLAYMAEQRRIAVENPSDDEFDTRTAIKLGSGPGRLCEAFQVDRSLDGLDLSKSDTMWLESWDGAGSQSWVSQCSQRIGISQARDLLLRWFVDGNRFVSGCARDHSNGRTWCFRSVSTVTSEISK